MIAKLLIIACAIFGTCRGGVLTRYGVPVNEAVNFSPPSTPVFSPTPTFFVPPPPPPPPVESTVVFAPPTPDAVYPPPTQVFAPPPPPSTQYGLPSL